MLKMTNSKTLKDGRFQLTPFGEEKNLESLSIWTLYSQLHNIIQILKENDRNPEDINIILSDVEGNDISFLIPDTELLHITNEEKQVKTSLLLKYYSDYEYKKKFDESIVYGLTFTYGDNSEQN